METNKKFALSLLLLTQVCLVSCVSAGEYCSKYEGMCDTQFRVFQLDSGAGVTTSDAHLGAMFTVLSKSTDVPYTSGAIGKMNDGTPVSLIFTEMQANGPGETFFCDYTVIRTKGDRIGCAKPHPRRPRVMEVVTFWPLDHCPLKEGEKKSKYEKCAGYEVKYCHRAALKKPGWNECDDIDKTLTEGEDVAPLQGLGGDLEALKTLIEEFVVKLKGIPDQGSGTGGN